MSGFRLASGGVRIDRARPIGFTWEGRRLTGFAGDTLASALLANGVSVVGRSFKYHRPRGVLAAGLEEPNAIVQVGAGARSTPNLKATTVELLDGLEARAVNAWPSAARDAMAWTGLFKRFLPAGFYYKSFMWPNWHLFEPSIRRAAGLGRAPDGPDPDRYEHAYEHVDTLVIGGGVAGLAAARAAARKGGHALLIEADGSWGGGLAGTDALVEGISADDWIAHAVAELRSIANVTMRTRALAVGYYDHDLVAVAERLSDHLPPGERHGPRERLLKVRARRVILATGAFERPLLFGDNDRPGVMLASAAQAYLARFGVAPGRGVVVATDNDSAYPTARSLAVIGVAVTLVDSRPGAPAMEGVRVLAGATPVRALGSPVRALVVARGGATEKLACDAVLVSGGWSPVVHLHSQAGGQLRFDDGSQAFVPDGAAQNATSVGAAAGVFAPDAAVASATAVGHGDVAPAFNPSVARALAGAAPPGEAHRTWVDYQSDVTAADVALAHRESFRSVEHVKRYTTLGMATDQGKTSNVVGIGLLAGLEGTAPGAVGTTKFRPPYDPTTIGLFAGQAVGRDLMPLGEMPAHAAHVAAGARIEQYGGWARPAFYPREGEGEAAAAAREALNVRRGVGLFDASPLGKIEVVGPDAGTFLDRMIVGRVSTLAVGRCRYTAMLNENGIVYDDGVTARLGPDHFLFGTTSGHARAVAERFEEWLQCEWPDLNLLVRDVSQCWAVMNVAGPRARDTLTELSPGVDLSREAFPFMTMRVGAIGDVPVRIARVSFSGELSYEVSVPSDYGAGLWEALLAAGAPHGIQPFGVEALMTLRVEKGFLHIGSDTDGATLPQDVGFAGPIASKPTDFVGRRSTMRPDALREDRRQLVGLEVADGGGALPVGGHVLGGGAREPLGTEGWVTSSVLSPVLSRPVALGLVVRGRARLGEAVRVWDMGAWRKARIAPLVSYDLEGARNHD